MKKCIIPRGEFAVGIYVILNTSDKWKMNIDNQRGFDNYEALQVQGDRNNT
jgi:hypothetical protein